MWITAAASGHMLNLVGLRQGRHAGLLEDAILRHLARPVCPMSAFWTLSAALVRFVTCGIFYVLACGS